MPPRGAPPAPRSVGSYGRLVHQLVLFSSASVGTPLRTRQRGSRVRDPVSGWGLVLTTQTTQLFPIVGAEVVGL